MKLSATIKTLKKNLLKVLTTQDVLSHEIYATKRKAKWDKLVKALQDTTGLKNVKLFAYTKPLSELYQPLVPLAKLIKALADNTSVESIDVSHNHLDEAAVEALAQLVQQPQLPLRQLFIDYINHSLQVNLKVIIDKLENHPTLEKLSLQNNELSTETCQSLLKVIMSKSNTINEISLIGCNIYAEDFKKLQAAAIAKGKKFILNVDAIDAIISSQSSNDAKTDNGSSYLKIKPIILSKPPMRLVKSDGDAPSHTNYGPLFSPSMTAPAEEVNPHISLQPKSKSATDINERKENLLIPNFK